jgi:catechol 2,3-dioxygenase-like lactoylglutathione lyase family enzyme
LDIKAVILDRAKLTYITLWVQAYDDCLAFYRDQLGLPLEAADENFAQFTTQGTHLYLHRLGSAPPLREHSLEIHFEVPDVDEAYESLLERGVRFDSPPANMPWGTRMAACRDPEGFHVEIVGPLKD